VNSVRNSHESFKFGATILSITSLSIITLSITTFSIMTLSITKFSIMTLSIEAIKMRHSA
jgi:hypothetical protein